MGGYGGALGVFGGYGYIGNIWYYYGASAGVDGAPAKVVETQKASPSPGGWKTSERSWK